MSDAVDEPDAFVGVDLSFETETFSTPDAADPGAQLGSTTDPARPARMAFTCGGTPCE